MKSWKRMISMLLTAAMLFALAVPSVSAAESAGGSNPGVTWEKVDAAPRALSQRAVKLAEEEPAHAPDEMVRVTIVFKEASAIGAGYSTENIASNSGAKAYRNNLKKIQDSYAKIIASKALNNTQLDVVWNLTLVTNAISANVPFGKIEAIKQIPGVKDVILEARYEPAVASKEADSPNMSVASEMTGGALAWAAGYTGAGSKVAIVDTGLDLEHELFQPDALEYALEQDGLDVTLMTASDTAAVWDQLHASEFISDAAGTYQNAKVPFAVNYVDGDLDVTHVNDTQEEHGSHVAGIAAANRYIPAEGYVDTYAPALSNVMTQGEAPDAQILVMKVFGKRGGAYDSDYMAAIEDAIVLGADSVNLSLGSAAAGYVTSSGYQEIMNNLVNSDTVVVMSAGNSYGWSYATDMGGMFGNVLYSDGVNFDTVGSPGSYTNTLAVASVNNDGFTGAYLTADGENIFYTETSGYGNAKMTTVAGEYTYVLLDGPGVDDNDHVGAEGDDFLALGSDVISGKIAICSRGTSSFFAKANAAAAQGAAAVIIANNTAGTISMNLTGYEYSVPAVSITQADGAFLKEIATEKEANGMTYYEGTITVSASIGSIAYDSEYYTMSDFSSWGVPGDLSLKPEITAPGGDIYSANGYHKSVNGGYAGGHNVYESMSGTSMAAPQITGLSAVLAQYIKENDLTAKTGLTQRALINSLLMSTAEPLIEEDSGSYYSVLKQGAGLVDAEAAVNANTYVLMDADATASYADGKVKAELGDDPDRKGSYSFGFTLNNLTDEDAFYDLSADFFTQDIFAYYTIDGQTVAVDADGNPIVSTYLDTWTVPLDATVTWTVDNEPYVPDSGEELDFNGDEVFNVDDAKAILEYVVNGTELTGKDADKADMDEDGDIDTYDAYLALLGFAEASVVVPANGSTHVVVDVTLNDIADYDDAGAYVEGFVYASEKTSDEGVEGTVHSIPVLGYYGSWTEPEMTDVADRYTRLAGEEDRTPYLAGQVNNAALNEAFAVNYEGIPGTYYLGGNPVWNDETYLPERNSINAADRVAAFYFSLIRNAAGGQFTAKNADTNEVLTQFETPSVQAAYYSVNQATWYSTSTNMSLGYKPGKDIAEGETLDLNVRFAPEYYLNDDGAIDWDSVHENAGTSLQLVIDNTAPEITNIFAGINGNEKAEGLTIDIAENRYIAGVFIFNEEGWNNAEELLAFGSDLDETEGADRTIFVKSGTEEGEIDLSAEENQHLMVEVYDYAANVTTYKLNLNTKELEAGVTELEINPESAATIPGNTIILSVSAEPWGASEEVTWSSSDESIATVNEKGIVTGVAVGECDIIAVSVANPEISATCHVTVKEFALDLNGVVWDEEGEIWFSEFNTKTLPDYTKLSDERCPAYIDALTFGADGVLYGADIDTSDGSSILYTVDPETFELTEIGGEGIGMFDLAPSVAMPGYLMTVYGPYMILIDTSDGSYTGYGFTFNNSRNIEGEVMVGIALVDYYEYEVFGSVVNMEEYAVLDDLGNIYLMECCDFTGTRLEAWGFKYMVWDLMPWGNIGESVDTDHFNSLYYDGENLFWSRFSESEDKVDLIMVEDFHGEANVFNLGSFADKVWPVGGLFELDKPAVFSEPRPLAPTENGNEAVDQQRVEQYAGMMATTDDVKAYATENAAPKGSLNAVTVTEPAPAVEQPEGVELTDEETTDVVTITVTADEANNNGLYSVDYDAEELELVSAESEIQYNVINTEEAGKVVIGYATLTEVAEGDEVLVVTFTQKTGKGTDITVTTEESGEEHPEDESETVTVGRTPAESVTVDPENLNLTIGDTTTVEITVEPEDCTDEIVVTSGDETVVVVNEDGSISAVGIGSTTITVTVGEQTVIIPVTVHEKTTPRPDYPVTPVTPVQPTQPAAKELPFKDVKKGDWFYDAVADAYFGGLMNGISATEFAPDGILTRAQVVRILWNLEGQPAAGESSFKDVAPTAYYAKAVAWANANGIVAGISATEFAPDRAITREQFAAIVYRYAKFKGIVKGAPGALTFADASSVSAYAVEALSWASANGIISGMGGNLVVPQGTATRAQAAVIFSKLAALLG